MNESATSGFGRRLKRYRQLAGLSAVKLAEETGDLISRPMISNWERGAKTDVTVDQLLALAVALRVPPVALALPLDRPNAMIQVAPETSHPVNWVAGWFTGREHYDLPFVGPPLASTALAESIIATQAELDQANADLYSASKAIKSGERYLGDEDDVRDANVRIQQLKKRLLAFGVDLDAKTVADVPDPDEDDGDD